MKKQNVRDLIFEAGMNSFHGMGFNACSVQDITSAAGVPKGSFYNHFDSKEALGAEIVDRYRENSKLAVLLADQSVAPGRRLQEYFTALNQRYGKSQFARGCLLGNFGMELSDQSELIREHTAAAFAQWSSELESVVAEAQAAGEMPDELSAAELASFLLNSWEGAVMRAKIDKSRTPLDIFMKFALAPYL
ncbi:TetR/AcrR family transcriptional regulator [Undibacterium terreum]|uniref:Transcriptional regulator n=1 Tax=Undibacterium terreum TaxID=1224302 RepID=A0A916UV93_9BURK|nr:TetR/AcrR family transcriptional regulator [Undibacterium terreum]GGC90140.1 transcriptional regulator [Undibacterium terreum]